MNIHELDYRETNEGLTGYESITALYRALHHPAGLLDWITRHHAPPLIDGLKLITEFRTDQYEFFADLHHQTTRFLENESDVNHEQAFHFLDQRKSALLPHLENDLNAYLTEENAGNEWLQGYASAVTDLLLIKRRDAARSLTEYARLTLDSLVEADTDPALLNTLRQFVPLNGTATSEPPERLSSEQQTVVQRVRDEMLIPYTEEHRSLILSGWLLPYWLEDTPSLTTMVSLHPQVTLPSELVTQARNELNQAWNLEFDPTWYSSLLRQHASLHLEVQRLFHPEHSTSIHVTAASHLLIDQLGLQIDLPGQPGELHPLVKDTIRQASIIAGLATLPERTSA